MGWVVESGDYEADGDTRIYLLVLSGGAGLEYVVTVIGAMDATGWLRGQAGLASSMKGSGTTDRIAGEEV